MKKRSLALLLAAATLTAAPAIAQQGGFSGPDATSAANTNTAGKGGFVGPDVASTTVEQAKGLRDDAWVVLEGNIVRKMGKELYADDEVTSGFGARKYFAPEAGSAVGG